MLIQCPVCKGFQDIRIVGVPDRLPCPRCKGAGMIHDERTKEETKAKVQIVRMLFPR